MRILGGRRAALALIMGAALLGAPLVAHGQDPASSASAAVSVPPAPLPELPHLAPITHPEPDPGALKELDLTLERLTVEDDKTRASAATAIADATPSLVPAIRQRIQELRTSIDRDATTHVRDDARKAGRKKLHAEDGDDKKKAHADGDDKKKAHADGDDKKKAHAEDGDDKKKAHADGDDKKKHKSKDLADDDGDWLDFALATPHPKDKPWRDLVRLLAMERMLGAIGTTPAVRELVQLYAYFGDLVRVDLQRQMAKLKDKAVPALIEARQHDAQIVQHWANHELDALGRAIPGEAVGTSDTQILADVLRAYGRTRDVDAVRVILSFCNSDRGQLRDASREAVAAIGEPASWQLKDVYLSLTGQKPPREWSWDRLARELFALHDRARLAEVYKLMDDGVAAAAAAKYADAVAAFDKVLARSPLFERRKEMVPTYVVRAKELEKTSRDDALAMLRKALRLDPKGDTNHGIEAEIDYLEGALSIDRGTPDKFILARALELDPTNDRARQALASLDEQAVVRKTSTKRYLAAVAVGLSALIGMLLLARRRKTPKDLPPSPAAPSS